MRDKNCWVPCDGLYADIEDGSLKENVMKGWSECLMSFILSFSGFQKIMHKYGRDDELHQSLQELFASSSSDEKLEDMMALTKAYHNYKMKYVKHISFSPEKENLSEATFIISVLAIDFSFDARACPIRGSVHLL